MSLHEMSYLDYRTTIDPANEGVFTRIVMREAEERGFLAYHTHDSRRSPAGFPDLVLVHPEKGGVIFAELKMPKKYPTPQQRVWLTTLAAAGQRVYLWRPSDYRDILLALDGESPPGYEVVLQRRRVRYARSGHVATGGRCRR